MTKASILYDGWLLVHQPNSPAALHLWSLLMSCPDGFQPVVAIPASVADPLPTDIQTVLQPMQKSAWSRLSWEQRILPALARRVGACFIHTVSRSAPLLSSVPVIVSDVEYETQPFTNRLSFPERLYASLGQGGLERARAILQPEDIAFQPGKRVQRVKPFALPGLVSPTSQPVAPSQLPQLKPGDTFVLYHGPGDLPSLHRLINAWSWAAGSLGDPMPLILAGLSHLSNELIPNLMLRYGVMGNVIVLPNLPLEGVAGLYRDCYALFHPGLLTPWGEPVRSALAAGKPVVAALTRGAEALVGPAAYLAPLDDDRALGAALISVLVDQKLADQLTQAARQHSAPWREVTPSQALAPVYRNLLGIT